MCFSAQAECPDKHAIPSPDDAVSLVSAGRLHRLATAGPIVDSMISIVSVQALYPDKTNFSPDEAVSPLSAGLPVDYADYVAATDLLWWPNMQFSFIELEPSYKS